MSSGFSAVAGFHRTDLLLSVCLGRRTWRWNISCSSRIPSQIPKPSSLRAQKLHVRRRGLAAHLFTVCWGLTPGGPTIG